MAANDLVPTNDDDEDVVCGTNPETDLAKQAVSSSVVVVEGLITLIAGLLSILRLVRELLGECKRCG